MGTLQIREETLMQFYPNHKIFFTSNPNPHKQQFKGIGMGFNNPANYNVEVTSILDVCGAQLPTKLSDEFVPFKVTNDVRKNIKLYDKQTHVALVFDVYGSPRLPTIFETLTVDMKKARVACAWDKTGFAIAASGACKSYVHDLRSAFLRKDIIIGGKTGKSYEGPDSVFRLLIPSMMPKSEIQDSINYYTGAVKKNERVAKLLFSLDHQKIKNKLIATGKTWDHMSFDLDIRGNLTVVLVPADKTLYNRGRFKHDDLKLWLKGAGPIVK